MEKQDFLLSLTVMNGPQDGRVFYFDKDTVTFGRSKEHSDVYVSYDTFVSRNHAKVFVEDEKIFLEDLESTNGTFLNDKANRVTTRIELKDEDLVLVGNTFFRAKLLTKEH